MNTLVVGFISALLSVAATPLHQGESVPKPIRVEREYIRPAVENTWDELVRSSDLVAEVEPVSAAGGEVTHYYGSYKSVVTAYSASITRVIAGGDHRGVVTGSRILVVMPGGKIDRGTYVQHVIVQGSEPLNPGQKYVVALKWVSQLEGWRPLWYYETVFEVQPDGRIRSFGNGPLAREINGASRASLLERLRVAASAQ